MRDIFCLVNYLNRYKIPIKGLALGAHEVNYDVDNLFFGQFDGSEIQRGDVKVTVHAQKASSFVQLDFDIEGTVWVECDRCLDEFLQKISYQGSLFVKFSSILQDEEGDVIYVDPNEGELNLASYIYESICLSLPLQRVHPKDESGKSTCNLEMLERLEAIETNFNDEVEEISEEEADEEEMPWEEIKKLIENSNKKTKK